MGKLTDKQRLFIEEYLVDLNATRAYKAAYPSCKKDESAAVNGAKLLRKANVKEKLAERMKEREKRTEITQDKVLMELYNIACANGSDFAKVVEKQLLDDKGNPIINPSNGEPIYYKTVDIELTDMLPEEKRKAIAGIKMGKNGIEVNTCDKVRALELLGRHLGLWNDKLDVKGDLSINNPYQNLTEEQLLKIAKDT